MALTKEEFVQAILETEECRVKELIREEKDFDSTILTEEQINDLKEEVLIEDFEEEVLWEEEINLEESFICEETNVETYLNFVPNLEESSMDLEMEIDEDYLNEECLDKIVETLYAEGYEILDEAGSNKGAVVVFKRAKGKISKMKKCGKGFRLKGNRCIPQTGSQKAKNRMKGIRLKRAKRAMGMGKKKRAALKAKITKKRVTTRARNYAGTSN
jgi:hypothetical protein